MAKQTCKADDQICDKRKSTRKRPVTSRQNKRTRSQQRREGTFDTRHTERRSSNNILVIYKEIIFARLVPRGWDSGWSSHPPQKRVLVREDLDSSRDLGLNGHLLLRNRSKSFPILKSLDETRGESVQSFEGLEF